VLERHLNTRCARVLVHLSALSDWHCLPFGVMAVITGELLPNANTQPPPPRGASLQSIKLITSSISTTSKEPPRRVRLAVSPPLAASPTSHALLLKTRHGKERFLFLGGVERWKTDNSSGADERTSAEPEPIGGGPVGGSDDTRSETPGLDGVVRDPPWLLCSAPCRKIITSSNHREPSTWARRTRRRKRKLK